MATLTSKLIVSLTDMVSGPAKGIGAALDRLHVRASKTSTGLLGVGGTQTSNAVRNLLAIGAGYVGVREGIGGTVGAAIKFEEAFADVRKVVNGTPAELSKIRSEILSMSKVLPNSAAGIAAIYAAAGQSNIPINELSRFSEMVAKVAVAWEVTEGETSEALAKIKNQLNMNVDQIGLYADAINHLGNNTAANAPNLVDFSKRVAANGEMFGFSATQTLAFGGAMIAAGGQTEVAATSFRNMGRALTIGTRATKMQRTAFSRLGLDAVKTAKSMQKNALETTLDVLDRIQALPAWERTSIASALFGDEARAMMPVIANSSELRRQLGLVANEADYAGSSFEEYLVRAETAGNALAIIGNKFRALGIGVGDSWLPTIKELGAGIGDVLDTLDRRVGVLDQVKVAFQGFMGGLGYGGTGGARELMNDLGDMLFGKAFGGDLKQADDRVSGLARLSNRFRGIGQDLKSFADNVSGANFGEAAGNIGYALTKMSGSMTVAGALAIGLVGRGLMGIAAGAVALMFSPIGRIAMVATAVATLIEAVKGAESLGDFAENLKALSAIEWAAIGAGIVMLVGPVGRLAGAAGRLGRNLGLIRGGSAAAAAGGGGAAAGRGAAAVAGAGLTALGTAALAALGVGAIAAAIAKFGPDAAAKARKPEKGEPAWWLGIDPTETREERLKRLNINPEDGFSWKKFFFGKAADPDFDFREYMKINRGGAASDAGPQDVSLVGVPEVSIPAPVTTQPSGTQDVRVTNPVPAPVINITVNAQTNADAGQIAAATERALSDRLNALSRGAYSDGAN